jgi:hypothetical protein
MEGYADLADFEEDDRIRMIGEAAMKHHKIVGFVVENEPGKADRYIRKLQKRFPGIRLIGRGTALVPDTELIRVGPPLT